MATNHTRIDYLKRHSAYAMRWLSANPSWESDMLAYDRQAIDAQHIKELLAKVHQDYLLDPRLEYLAQLLRRTRQKFMLALGYRDLNGLAPLTEVTQGMSYFAEAVIEVVIEAVSQDLSLIYGKPMNYAGEELPLMVVGMGKLGGRELNVSSDIDLVFIYEEDGETQGGSKSLSHHEWYTRLARKLIGLLSELGADGFVFRVDMRLRPNGDSGPLVCSLGMLEEYFTVQGREWERYAWIKGRMIHPAESQPAYRRQAKLLQDIVRPFVFRRYLDFGVLAAIRDIHAQIQYEAEKRSSAYPERASDIKLGRGGIREIEFLAQMFQLVRGGKDPALRIRPTLDVLKVLEDKQLLTSADYLVLTQAYDYLRKLEHRLQYWEDAQTHHVPNDELAQERLSQTMGHASLDEFRLTLSNHRQKVAALFSEAFVLKEQDTDSGDALPSDGIWMPEPHLQRIVSQWNTWLTGPKSRALSDESRRKFMHLMSVASVRIKHLVSEKQFQDEMHVRMMLLLEAISKRSSYLALLIEYPHVLDRIISLIKSSKWGTDYLVRHPHLLDDLLTGEGQFNPEDHPEVYWAKLRQRINLMIDDALEQGDHVDQAMDVLRQVHHTETFHTLLAELGIGRDEPLAIEKVSDRLSALADLMLSIALERVWPGVVKKYHGDPLAEPQFAVIAYGKLGGKELGYASDLDIVFIYDAKSDDQEASERYAYLARRLIAWLTTATSAGILFEIDTRLRPNGAAGLLVTSVEAFRTYQLREADNAAWVWEHQALTRARFCAGDKELGKKFEAIRVEVLSQIRDENSLKQEIILMRQKVRDGHPNDSDTFDVKHDVGGMVDIEFVVQYLVLRYASQYSELLGNWGNIALLHKAADVGLITKELSMRVSQAYRMYREYQHRMRLDGAEKTRVSLDHMPQELLDARQAVEQLWDEILGAQ